MTPRQIVTVTLRLLAIWLGIGVLRTLPSFVLFRASNPPGYTYALFTFALTAVLVLGLWFFPATIAGKIVSSSSAESPQSTSPDTWFAMGCCLMGLWILTTTIPHLLLNVYFLNVPGFDVSRPSMIYEAAEAVIALWLILGGRGFRRLFWWARNAGIDKAL